MISWEDHLIKTSGLASASHWLKRSFPLDVMAAILVGKNNPLGIIFYFMQISSFHRINRATGHVGKNCLLVSMISAKQVLSYSSLVIIPERITSDSKNILCSSYLARIHF